jgi:ABC-type transport system involved in multi-copper enzyme maturation permease subunit
LWSRQVEAIARLEMKRYMAARKWLGVYLVALAPVFLAIVAIFRRDHIPELALVGLITERYAVLFEAYMLRFAIFISCGVIFSQLIRGDILEKTLHYHLMAPVRREVIVLGKYAASVIFTFTLFGVCTLLSFVLLYYPVPAFSSFFLDGPGIPHLLQYLATVLVACLSYGALSLLIGILFKNPGPPMLMILGWESLSFLMPETLQQFSIVHYLHVLMPIGSDRGAFALVSEPTAPIIGIPLLFIMIAVALTAAGLLLRRAEVTYSAD